MTKPEWEDRSLIFLGDDAGVAFEVAGVYEKMLLARPMVWLVYAMIRALQDRS